MLTQANYNDLWTNVLGLPLQDLPIYYIYLQREVYFQDYLDLFCCPNNERPSFERIIGQFERYTSPVAYGRPS